MAQEKGKITIIKRNGQDGVTYPLVSDCCLFGSGLDCDIRVQLPMILDHHCVLRVAATGQFYLTSYSTANPTLLNDGPVRATVPVVHGDIFTVADRCLRFEYPAESIYNTTVVINEFYSGCKLSNKVPKKSNKVSKKISSLKTKIPKAKAPISLMDVCKSPGRYQFSTKKKVPRKSLSSAEVPLFSDDEFSAISKSDVLPFKTAKEQLDIEQPKKYGMNPALQSCNMVYGNNRKCLGTRLGPSSRFVPPVLNKGASDGNEPHMYDTTDSGSLEDSGILQDERLKNIDPKMVKLILNEIMDHGPPVSWDDIAGLEFAKNTIKEIVVWPMLRPDIFTGLRGPPKGILLFGPPGTGKTLIGKCIASQSKSTFFCISASSLTSKWVGEGEKLVRALFAVVGCYRPAVIFIDEIDSLLTRRSESSRRMKTEFLVQLDGATTSGDERLLIVGATNRPQKLDEAARRRLVKRLYIRLPESHARKQIIQSLLCDHSQTISSEDLEVISEKTAGYSGADMANLCKEAALGPIRSLNFDHIENINADQVRPINLKDFIDALQQVRASVSDKDLELYSEWNKKYGSGSPL